MAWEITEYRGTREAWECGKCMEEEVRTFNTLEEAYECWKAVVAEPDDDLQCCMVEHDVYDDTPFYWEKKV